MSGKRERRKRRKVEIVADLQAKLQAHGYQYVGDNDTKEMERVLRQVEALRKDKPPCWARSFDPRAERCLKCELIKECGEVSVQPRFDLEEPGEPVECPVCDGDLIIELYGDDGKVTHYACSSEGCSQVIKRTTISNK